MDSFSWSLKSIVWTGDKPWSLSFSNAVETNEASIVTDDDNNVACQVIGVIVDRGQSSLPNPISNRTDATGLGC